MAAGMGRIVALLAAAAVGAARPGVGVGQRGSSLLQLASPIAIEGRFARYLRTPAGDITGLVLEDGTLALLRDGETSVPGPLLRKGAPLRLRGIVVRGVPGPVLVHASVDEERTPLLGLGLRVPPCWPDAKGSLALPGELRLTRVERLASARPAVEFESTRSATASPPRGAESLYLRRPGPRRWNRLGSTVHWFEHLTSEPNHAAEPRWTRQLEDAGP
jgi:hypothetical protein